MAKHRSRRTPIRNNVTPRSSARVKIRARWQQKHYGAVVIGIGKRATSSMDREVVLKFPSFCLELVARGWQTQGTSHVNTGRNRIQWHDFGRSQIGTIDLWHRTKVCRRWLWMARRHARCLRWSVSVANKAIESTTALRTKVFWLKFCRNHAQVALIFTASECCWPR